MMAQQSGSGIRAGGAYVELWTKNDIQKGLDAARAKLQAFGKVVMGIGGGLTAAGAGILGPLGVALNTALGFGDEMQKAALRVGTTVEELSELRHVAEQNGATFEDLEKALVFMAKNGFGAGADGMEKFADEIAAMTNPMAQTARAMEVFGRGGIKMMPTLKSGAEGIRALRQEARDLGIVLSQDSADAAATLGDQIANLKKQFHMIVVEIGNSLIPGLTGTGNRLMVVMKQTIDFIRSNRDMIVGLAGLGVALVAAGAAVTAIGVGIVGVSMVLGALMTPLGLAVAGLGALAAIIGGATITKAGLQRAMAGVAGFAIEMKTALADAVTFIQNGDIESAWKVVWLTLRIEFLKFMDWLEEQWERFGKGSGTRFVAGMEEGLVDIRMRMFELFNQDAVKADPRLLDSFKAEKAKIRQASMDAAQKMKDTPFVRDEERMRQIDKLESERLALEAKAFDLRNKKGPSGIAGLIIAGAGEAAGEMAGTVRPFHPMFRRFQAEEAAMRGMDFAQQTKGTFSGRAIGQSFNVADRVVAKIQDNTKQTADNTQGILDKIGKTEVAEFE